MTIRLWGNHIAGPVLAVIAIFFVIASAAIGGDATLAAKMVKWSAWLTGIATVLLMFVAQYDAWRETDRELDREKAKNEAQPHMDIRMKNVVPFSHDGSTMTDMFLYVELVLEEPSQVAINSFTLDVSDQGQCIPLNATDDVREWQWIRGGNFKNGVVDVEPLIKELTQRGDPVRGWIHFPMPGLSKALLQGSVLTLKINCEHGTCYFGIDSARIKIDPSVKGLMWKRPKIHETA
ncbi:MAG: hypothetical protein WCA27_06410 [Candidatus Sulfotelmatobacter sp.]